MEFREFREFQDGDDARFIDWKAFARTQKLKVREFDDALDVDKGVIVVDYREAEDLCQSREEALSQICFWVDETAKSGRTFVVRGFANSPTQLGSHNLVQCFRVLAES